MNPKKMEAQSPMSTPTTLLKVVFTAVSIVVVAARVTSTLSRSDSGQAFLLGAS